MSSILTLILFFVIVVIALALGFAIFYLRKVHKAQVDGLYYQSKQGPIFYKILGQKGPVVLLIHGLGASTYCWRNVAPDLSRKYKVVVFDLWGFGNSSKSMQNPMTLDSQTEVIQELMDHLQISKCHIVGHSMGAQIGMWLKLNDPRVDRLVAVTPSAHPSLVSDWLHRFAWIANLTPLVLTAKAIRRILVRSLEDPGFVTEEMVQSYYEPYTDPAAHRTFAAALNIISDWRVWDHLDDLDDSTTILFAAHDLVIARKLMVMMAEKFPGKNIITHPWSGHLPMEDDHQWLVEQVLLALKP